MSKYAEQIAAYEAKRAANAARMDAIMSKAGDEGATLDTAEQDEFDNLDADNGAIDGHLKRLKTLESAMAASAAPVDGSSAAAGSQSRSGVAIVRGSNLPKGTAFTRYAMALAVSKGNLMQAAEIAKTWHDSTPEVETVLRSAVAAGTTTDAAWAGPLVPYTQMASEFIELLRPATVLGKIAGLRRVPFNISMPRQTSASSAGWVGQGKPTKVGKLGFDTVTLRFAKISGIVPLTEELARFSNPSAEQLIQADLIATIAQFTDQQFLDPSVAAVADVNPASVSNGITPVPASGVDADAMRADFKSLVQQFVDSNISVAGCVWVMSEIQALGLSLMVNALGQREFPDISMTGGTLLGLPVVTSQIDATDDGASPTGNRIFLIKAPYVMLADDGLVLLDASREASIQMDSSPDDPTTNSTVLVSLWQQNLIGLKATRWINWQKRHDAAVQFIDNASYGDGS